MHGRLGGTLVDRHGLHDGLHGLQRLDGGQGHGSQHGSGGGQGHSGGHGRHGGHGVHAGTHGIVTHGSWQGFGGKFSCTDVLGSCEGLPAWSVLSAYPSHVDDQVYFRNCKQNETTINNDRIEPVNCDSDRCENCEILTGGRGVQVARRRRRRGVGHGEGY